MPATNTTEDREIPGKTMGKPADHAGSRAKPKTAKSRKIEEDDTWEDEDEDWDEDESDSQDHKFDLLTAALLGVAVGVGVTLLLRTGPGGRRPIGPLVRAMGRGASMAGLLGLDGLKWAGEHGAEGAEWAKQRAKPWVKRMRKRGQEAMDSLPDLDDVGEELREYMDGAKDAIEHMVREEVQDLRKALRSQRRKMGI